MARTIIWAIPLMMLDNTVSVWEWRMGSTHCRRTTKLKSGQQVRCIRIAVLALTVASTKCFRELMQKLRADIYGWTACKQRFPPPTLVNRKFGISTEACFFFPAPLPPPPPPLARCWRGMCPHRFLSWQQGAGHRAAAWSEPSPRQEWAGRW